MLSIPLLLIAVSSYSLHQRTRMRSKIAVRRPTLFTKDNNVEEKNVDFGIHTLEDASHPEATIDEDLPGSVEQNKIKKQLFKPKKSCTFVHGKKICRIRK